MPITFLRVIWIIVLIIKESGLGNQNLRNGLKGALKDLLYEIHGGPTRDYQTDVKMLELDNTDW